MGHKAVHFVCRSDKPELNQGDLEGKSHTFTGNDLKDAWGVCLILGAQAEALLYSRHCSFFKTQIQCQYPYFVLEIAQDAMRKLLLIKQETE